MKGSSSSAMVAFWLSFNSLDFRKQFTIVFVITASQAATFPFLVTKKFLGEFFSYVQHSYDTLLSVGESLLDPLAESEKVTLEGGKTN